MNAVLQLLAAYSANIDMHGFHICIAEDIELLLEMYRVSIQLTSPVRTRPDPSLYQTAYIHRKAHRPQYA